MLTLLKYFKMAPHICSKLSQVCLSYSNGYGRPSGGGWEGGSGLGDLGRVAGEGCLESCVL